MWFSSQRENNFYILHGSNGAAPTERIPFRGGEMNFKGRFFEAFISGAWKSKSRCPEVVPCRKQVQVSLRLISLLQAVKNPFFKAPEKVRRKKKKKPQTQQNPVSISFAQVPLFVQSGPRSCVHGPGK